MSNSDFHRDRPSLQLLGKEFIIVVVVIFSALSFALGYFVGKSTVGLNPEDLSPASEMTPIPQNREPEALPPPSGVSVAENAPPIDETAGEGNPPQPKDTLVMVEAKQAEPADDHRTAKKQTQEQAVSPKKTKENSQKPAAKESTVSQENKTSDEPVYTLQLGAFKNSAEAESVRKKYAAKGFKSYITVSTDKNQEKIYKVKTGEFRDKKSAEVLSLKLNKTEKLKTFVTLKSE